MSANKPLLEPVAWSNAVKPERVIAAALGSDRVVLVSADGIVSVRLDGTDPLRVRAAMDAPVTVALSSLCRFVAGMTRERMPWHSLWHHFGTELAARGVPLLLANIWPTSPRNAPNLS